MSLIPRDNWFDFDHPFEQFFPTVSRFSKSFTPKVDIVDKDTFYEIRADLPGVNKDDIKIELDNGVLSLSAFTSQQDKEEKDGKVIRQERFNGSYHRSFTVGDNIHESDIQASFDKGVLTIKAPKLEPTKTEAKRISIT